MSTPVGAAFGGEGHLCSTLPAVPPSPPPPGCQVQAIMFVTAAFTGAGALCSGCGPPPSPPPPPPCACHVDILHPGALTGAGALSALIGPYTTPFFEVTGTFYAVADPSVSGTINNPIMQPVNALVSFTPRLPIGYQAFVADYQVSAAFNAQQTLSMIGNPIQGTWTVTYANYTTTVMPFNVSPAGLQAALAALPSIGSGNVTVVAGINPQSYNVQFTGTLGNTAILPLDPQWFDLIDANGYDCTITVAVSATGSPQIVAPTSISIPPRSARIMAGALSTIDYVDTAGVQLVSNSPILAIPAPYYPLIYDVAFSAATFNDANQVLANFAFVAPVDSTPVCITDPGLEKLDYQKPIPYIWSVQTEEPSETPNTSVVAMSDWRTRAAARRVAIG